MTTKQQILLLLEQNRGNAVSGQYLAQQLGVSRNAISKAINSLKEQGHNISAVTNKGYTMCLDSDIIEENVLREYLCCELKQKPITILSETTSTNILAKKAAENGAQDASIFIANKQTEGKGRKGRSFCSPEGGLYISMVIRRDLPIAKSTHLTTHTAVAVCHAVEKVCNITPKIKWVNDIFYNDKKLCGILTEGSISVESTTLEYAVIGVGINFYNQQKTFDETSLNNIATGIYEKGVDGKLRTLLAAQVINNIYNYSLDIDSEQMLSEYKKYSFVLGEKIKVMSTPPRQAVAVDINKDYNLLVEYDNKEKQYLSSGEISILPLNEKE